MERTTYGKSPESLANVDTSEIVFRLAEETDLSQLQQLWLYQRNHHLQYDSGIYAFKRTAAKNWVKDIASALSNPDQCILVAIQRDSIVGYIHGAIYPWPISPLDYYASLNTIAVSQDAQWQGIGKQLVHHLLRWFEAHPLSPQYVSLHVDYRNEPALRLYQKIGFQPYQQRLMLEFAKQSVKIPSQPTRTLDKG